ncbi:MAG: FtsX-like permease family protein, partial [Pyrinomonadaceae bacterium]|nr:FtsX-like permease family protein [Sphingobacteriaceae bacterium]
PLNPAEGFILKTIHPIGVFKIQREYDESVLVPLRFARELLEEEKNISAIEIYLKPGASVSNLQEYIEEKLGKKYIVKNRIQQDEQLYKTMNVERWFIFVMLTFVLSIAIFNIIGTLTMLVIDKKKDIAILTSIGASTSLIRKIFFIEGMMISLIGCFAGMLVGLGFCLIQQQYGLISMGQNGFITDAYPVSLKLRDFILVFLTVSTISMIASAISSRLSVNRVYDLREDL